MIILKFPLFYDLIHRCVYISFRCMGCREILCSIFEVSFADNRNSCILFVNSYEVL